MRPKEKLDLPNGWYDEVLELYSEGASDVEVKALIYTWRGSFSNDLWERWLKEEDEFSEVIKKGIKIRGNKRKIPTDQKHLDYLKHRRLNRKNEYKGNNKIVVSLRSLLSYHLKNKNVNFSKKTFELLGYSKNDYIENILGKLHPNMTIENYGQWHVDHIKPCSKFDLSKESEIKKCWDLNNLQPLWAIDNLKKSNKYGSR